MSLFDDYTVTRGEYTCPWCGETNDAAMSIHDPTARPKTGDVGVCVKCSRPMIYQEVGKPRRPTEGEWADINANESINQLRRALFFEGAKHGRVHYEDIEIRAKYEDD